MNLVEEFQTLCNAPADGNVSQTILFWALVEITQEMAKRIEELERKVQKHHYERR